MVGPGIIQEVTKFALVVATFSGQLIVLPIAILALAVMTGQRASNKEGGDDGYKREPHDEDGLACIVG
ncbi:hypothetical protein JAAARDRAFT_36323 [Jaapia argillacea MUCL 33604]|uniref:Uncharacterized protein n=1 Tax=Jaapia argillacea MUCL 33604 TaxID=933084 RepID=A0A067PPZ2_9AGAM|nr:hypothetical protein JAAARDRAFT_36323 [Jaapia argillacea MUCL 33604]